MITIWSSGPPSEWQDTLIEGVVLECRSVIGNNIEVLERLVKGIGVPGEQERDWQVEDSCTIGVAWIPALRGLIEGAGLVPAFEVLRSLGLAVAPIVLASQAEPLYRASSLVTLSNHGISGESTGRRDCGVTVTPPWILKDGYELVGLAQIGPGLGSDTSAVLREWLGYSDQTISVLHKLGAFV